MLQKASLILFAVLLSGEVRAKEEITFVTYNLFHIYAWKHNPLVTFPVAVDTREERIPLQAREFKRLSPTFIVVQEAFHNRGRKRLVKLLSDRYGVVNHNRFNVGTGPIRFGSGQLIFYKRSQVRHVEGSEYFKKFPASISPFTETAFSTKGLLHADFVTRAGLRINVANVHLAVFDHDGTLRVQQVRWLKTKLAAVHRSRRIDLQLVGGDFNTHKFNEDGSLQAPIAAMLSARAGGFPTAEIFNAAGVKASPTWDPKSVMVDVTKWPLYNAEILDYWFAHSPTGRCGKPIRAEMVFHRPVALPTIGKHVEVRLRERREAMPVVRDTPVKVLDKMKAYRIRNGDKGWKWDRSRMAEIKALDPEGAIRTALDKLYGLTSISDVDFKDTGARTVRFPRSADGVYKAPLSDHYGVMGTVRCR